MSIALATKGVISGIGGGGGTGETIYAELLNAYVVNQALTATIAEDEITANIVEYDEVN